MSEQLAAIVDLLKSAIAEGQTITITADDVTIKPGTEIVINNLSVSTES